MKAIVFSASADPAAIAVLAPFMQRAAFGDAEVMYVLAKEFIAGLPMSTLSLRSGSPLKVDVQTHGIAAVLSGEGLRAAGFVPPA